MTSTTPRPADERRGKEMTPERWAQIDVVLQEALGHEGAARDAFVVSACGDDEWLRREVLSLLAAGDLVNTGFLETPALAAHDIPDAMLSPLQRLTMALEGRYVVEGEIAQGGMATVYLARDLRHQREVAVKVLHENVASEVGAERFLAEIRVTASLQHPNILPLFDSGNADGLLWYAMPWIEGETLRTRLTREGALATSDALRIAREVADALDHAHRQGIIHRDIKPENVLLRDGHALVADFGIALALQETGDDRLTRTGVRIGTPQYMAPEQAEGMRAIDARADVYSLGAVLQEMLTGKSPLTQLPDESGRLMRLKDGPDTPRLHEVIRRALQRQPEDRFPSAAAFSAALEAPAAPFPAPRSRPAEETPGRMVSARVASYVALVMLVCGLAGGWIVSRSPLALAWNKVALPDALADGGEIGVLDAGALSLLDREGRVERTIAAVRPWAPRFSPDGKQVAYGAFNGPRETSDVWVTDLDGAVTRRLTNDESDSNDPQWSADGASLVYSVTAPGGKDLFVQPAAGGTERPVAAREGMQYPSDWVRDGSALLVTEEGAFRGRDVLVQPVDGSSARPYAATMAEEYGARISPDGRWVAFVSEETGRPEVYLDSYPTPGRRVRVSSGAGIHPVWRGNGRELYYWSEDRLMAVPFAAGGSWPAIGEARLLFRAPYPGGPNAMYDVSPDGQHFIIAK